MYDEMKERVVIVTGAARGLGQGLAKAFAQEGAHLVGVDILDCDETGEIVTGLGAEWMPVELDLTDEAGVNAMVEKTVERFGRVNVLVNNAGVLTPVSFDDLDLETWNRIFAINSTSQFLTAKAAVPHMKAQKFGRIINVAAAIAQTPIPNFITYRASKMAVIGLTRGLATEMGEHGITVNAVSPSFVTTPGQHEVGNAHIQPFVTEQQAIKRDCVPEDLAGLVVFLASNGAGFITAQMFHADGGLTYK